MKLFSQKILLIVFSLCILSVACDDSSSDGVPDGETATFNGRVENTSSAQSSDPAVEGAVVTAAYVTADGELQTIGDTQAETNAEGEYMLEVDVSSSGDFANNIVIVAQGEEQSAKAFVTGEVENGTEFTVQPITFESSAETEVFQHVVAGNNSELVTKADIEATVEAEVAQDIESNVENAANVAAGLASAAEAKAELYAERGIEFSEDVQNQVIEAKQQAQLQLESELNAATSASEKQAAFNTFLQLMAQAELDAGIDAGAVAESQDFAARVLLKNSTSLSADAQSEIRKHFYFYLAVATDAAVQAEAEVVGASESTIDALVNAGATLRTDLRNTTNASEEQIESYFQQYNEDVQNLLNSDTAVNGSAFVSASTAINGSSGLKTTLESTLEATADVNTMLSAYSAFRTGVEGIVETTFTNASDQEVQAYTDLLVLINLAS